MNLDFYDNSYSFINSFEKNVLTIQAKVGEGQNAKSSFLGKK